MEQKVERNGNAVSLLLEGIMIVGIILCIGLLIALPFILWDIIVFVSREEVYGNPENYRWLMICLYPAIVLVIVVLNEVRSILHTLRKDSPFCERIPKSIKRISICAFVLSAVTAIKFILIPGLITALIMLGFLLAGLCFWVLGDVFEKAVAMKNENDLTI